MPVFIPANQEYVEFGDRLTNLKANNPYHLRFIPSQIQDPDFSKQYNLKNTGQYYGIPGEDIDLDFEGPTGQGIKVMVHDSGIRTNHTDIKHAIDPTLLFDFVFQQYTADPHSPEEFHGTACAGIIASARNDICNAGIAPNVTLGASVLPKTLTNDIIESSIMLNCDRIDIESNSYIVNQCDEISCRKVPQFESTERAINNAFTRGRDDKGILVVFGAGNDAEFLADTNIRTLTCWRNAFTVTGSTHSGQRATYATPGTSVCVNAPGGGSHRNSAFDDIPSIPTIHSAGDDQCAEMIGTSASAPTVAAIAAQLLQVNSNLTSRDVSLILMESATRNDPTHLSWQTNAAGVKYSPFYGFGRVSSRRALSLIEDWHFLEEISCMNESTETQMLDAIYQIELNDDVYIESVTMAITLDSTDFSFLRIFVESPMGTMVPVKQLMNIEEETGPITRNFVIRNFMRENARGVWKIKIFNARGTVSKVTLTAFGTATPRAPIQYHNGAEPYRYPRSKIEGIEITTLTDEITVGSQFTVQLTSDTNCTFDVYLEDTNTSSRIYLGSFFTIPGKYTVDISQVPPLVPDRWPGRLVFESSRCGGTYYSDIVVRNFYDRPPLTAVRHGPSQVELIWDQRSDKLPAETPANFVLISLADGSRIRTTNTGRAVVNCTTGPFRVQPAYCFTLDACWSVETSTILDKEPSDYWPPSPTPFVIPQVSNTPLIIGMACASVVLIVLVIALFFVRRHLQLRSLHRVFEAEDGRLDSLLSNELLINTT